MMMNNETKKAAENSRLLLKRRKKMDKKIKESKRGLTFSFTPTETMQIGSRYDYIISNSGIRIVPSETGQSLGLLHPLGATQSVARSHGSG